MFLGREALGGKLPKRAFGGKLPPKTSRPKTSLVSQLGGEPDQTSKAPFQDSDSRSVCAYGRLTPTTRLASLVYGSAVRAASRREGLANQDSEVVGAIHQLPLPQDCG